MKTDLQKNELNELARRNEVSPGGALLSISILMNTVVIAKGFTHDERWYWGMVLTVPLMMWAVYELLSAVPNRLDHTKTHRYENDKQTTHS